MLERSHHLSRIPMPVLAMMAGTSFDDRHSTELASSARAPRKRAGCYPQEILRNRYFLLNGESEFGRKEAEAFGAVEAFTALAPRRSQPLVTCTLWINRNVES